MNLKRWTDIEDKLLIRMAEKYPACLIEGPFNKATAKRGLTPRTRTAIEKRLVRLKISTENRIDYIPVQTLAGYLGLTEIRAKRWLEAGLPHTKTRYRYVSLEAFRNWAGQHPDLLSDADKDGLMWVLGDNEELVSKILATPLSVPVPRPHPVIASHGKRYRSKTQAAKDNGLTKKALNLRLQGYTKPGERVQFWLESDLVKEKHIDRIS